MESGEWSSAAFGLCFPVSNVNVFGNNSPLEQLLHICGTCTPTSIYIQ